MALRVRGGATTVGDPKQVEYFKNNEVVAPPPFVTHGSSRSVHSRDATKVKCPDGIGRESWVMGRAVAAEG